MLPAQSRTALFRLYGTAEEPAAETCLRAGPLEVRLLRGAVSGVFWHGVEVVRGVDYPVRDKDWGTASVQELESTVSAEDQRFSFSRAFTVAGNGFEGRFEITGEAGALTLFLSLTARSRQLVARAGFVVLHPLSVAGERLSVRHPDGLWEPVEFPRIISPSHPAMDIAALEHRVNGVATSVEFAGEVFEMEDQRNWSDASFKTYCRPLQRPYPYVVEDGEIIEQRIVMRLSGEPTQPPRPRADRLEVDEESGAPIPEVRMALDPAWPHEGRLGPAGAVVGAGAVTLRLDLRDSGWRSSLPLLLSACSSDFDLELVTSQQPDVLPTQLSELAQVLISKDISPRHVLVLPESYMRGIQPWHDAPPGAGPDSAAAAARVAFPEALVGGGALTNFTELNRSPVDMGNCDFIGHPISPLVHAADDASVMGALATTGAIFASGQARAPGLPYRLGLSAIGMRSNPYGDAVADNPEQLRLPMAAVDPRQRGLFAAAWMLGLFEKATEHGMESLVVGAPYGPFGLACCPAEWPQPLYDDDATRLVFPAWHVFSALRGLAGRTSLRLRSPDGLAAVGTRGDRGAEILLANLGPEPRTVVVPGLVDVHLLDTWSFDAATRDQSWVARPRQAAPGHDLRLGPYAVAFLTVDLKGEP